MDAYLIILLIEKKYYEANENHKKYCRALLCLYLVLLTLGCRPSDLNEMLVYDDKNMVLALNTEWDYLQITGKSKNSRRNITLKLGSTLDVIFRNNLITNWLSSRVSDRFSTYWNRITESYLKNGAGEYVKQIEYAVTKTFRKTHITWRRANGESPETIAVQCGHTKEVADSNYLNVNDFWIKASYEKKDLKVFWEWLNNCIEYNTETKEIRILHDKLPEKFQTYKKDFYKSFEV